jgi:hypothetical protein
MNITPIRDIEHTFQFEGDIFMDAIEINFDLKLFIPGKESSPISLFFHLMLNFLLVIILERLLVIEFVEHGENILCLEVTNSRGYWVHDRIHHWRGLHLVVRLVVTGLVRL